MRKTHKNNNSIKCDTLYTRQKTKTMIAYTDIMKKTMTNKTILERKENIYRILWRDPRNHAMRPDFFRLHQKS